MKKWRIVCKMHHTVVNIMLLKINKCTKLRFWKRSQFYNRLYRAKTKHTHTQTPTVLERSCCLFITESLNYLTAWQKHLITGSKKEKKNTRWDLWMCLCACTYSCVWGTERLQARGPRFEVQVQDTSGLVHPQYSTSPCHPSCTLWRRGESGEKDWVRQNQVKYVFEKNRKGKGKKERLSRNV